MTGDVSKSGFKMAHILSPEAARVGEAMGWNEGQRQGLLMDFGVLW